MFDVRISFAIEVICPLFPVIHGAGKNNYFIYFIENLR